MVVIFLISKKYDMIRAKNSVTKHAIILVALLVRLYPINDTISAKIICVINKKKYARDTETKNSVNIGRKVKYKMNSMVENSIRKIYRVFLYIFVK